MKTNQLFDFKRFCRYSKSTLTLTYRQLLMNLGLLAVVVFVLSMLVLSNSSNWNQRGWIMLFVPVLFGAGIAFAGFAFAPFRNREKTITELMLPVTAAEKFLYEFLLRIVVFMLLFPLVFYVFSSLAVLVSNSFHPEITRTVNGSIYFPYNYINLSDLRSDNPQEDAFYMLLSLAVFVFSLAFAGAATFRKNPLVKTVVFVGAVIALIMGYVYTMVETLHLKDPWLEQGFKGHHATSEYMFVFVSCIAACASLTVLAYAFFKLKEKEVV